jgi:hypothetical protein
MMGVIYEPNTTRWAKGDIVIHDADAKKPFMLMIVLGYDRKTKECITRYLYPSRQRYGVPDWKRYRNDIKYLHDPARFAITSPRRAA